MGFEKIRFRPAYFPYTEPSVEGDVWNEERKEQAPRETAAPTLKREDDQETPKEEESLIDQQLPDERKTEDSGSLSGVPSSGEEEALAPEHPVESPSLPAFPYDQVFSELLDHPQLPLEILVLGSGKGIEVYLTAMNFLWHLDPGKQARLRITAVEEHPSHVEAAMEGVYSQNEWEQIPQEWKSRFLLRNKDPQKALVKVMKEVADKVSFFHQPLLLGDNFEKAPYGLIWVRQPLDILGPQERLGFYQLIHESLDPRGYLVSSFDLENLPQKQWLGISGGIWKKI